MKTLERMTIEQLKELKRRIRYQWRTKNITSDKFEHLWDKVRAELIRRGEG